MKAAVLVWAVLALCLCCSCAKQPDAESVIYTIDNFNKDLPSEIKFLKQQQLVFWEKEKNTLASLGLKDGMAVLDMGGGPAFLSQHILEWLPKAKVTCFEWNQAFLDDAAQRLPDLMASGHLKLVQGNAAKATSILGDQRYDFVIIRLLLQHLENPQLALQHAYTLLKPGGTVLVIDSDEAIADIQTPIIRYVDRLWLKLEDWKEKTQPRVSDSRIGRKLPTMLAKAQFSSIRSDMHVTSSHEYAMSEFLPLIDSTNLYPLVKAGVVKESRLQKAQRLVEQKYLLWDETSDEEKPLVMCFVFAVSAKKPTTTGNNAHVEL